MKSMSEPDIPTDHEAADDARVPASLSERLRSNFALAFVLPLVVTLLITSFYPDFASSYEGDGFGNRPDIPVTSQTWTYLFMVTLQVILIVAAVIFFLPVYLKQFPFRISWLAVPVGILGVVLWIFLTGLGIERQLLDLVGFDSSRPSFNPYVIQNTGVFVGFLVVRFTLLTFANPIAEELFVRGWLVRWVDEPQFEKISLKSLSMTALFAASIYGVLSHPSEAIAAFVWFGLVTLLARYTGSLWDCIVAHAVTNFLLGVYVVNYQQWHLW